MKELKKSEVQFVFGGAGCNCVTSRGNIPLAVLNPGICNTQCCAYLSGIAWQSGVNPLISCNGGRYYQNGLKQLMSIANHGQFS